MSDLSSIIGSLADSCIYSVKNDVLDAEGYTTLNTVVEVANVASAVLFIFSILGLSQQESARAGNMYASSPLSDALGSVLLV